MKPTQTKWVSLMVFVPKKDGTFWFCIDYQKQNGATKRNSYSDPRMDECVATFVEAAIVSILYTNTGYRQIEIEEMDHDDKTFTSHHGLYRFTRRPSGLRNEQWMLL